MDLVKEIVWKFEETMVGGLPTTYSITQEDDDNASLSGGGSSLSCTLAEEPEHH